MSVDVVVGLQRGDEGKGRFVHALAPDYDIVARFNGGDNAGHTVVLPDERVLKLHLVPSGIAEPDIVNVIGRGTLVNPEKLAAEIKAIQAMGIAVTSDNLKIDSGATLILPHHISEDEIREAGDGRQGSTKSGIAPAASSKALRTGASTELIQEEPDSLKRLVIDGLIKQRQARREADLPEIDEEAVADAYLTRAQKIASFIMDTTVYLNQRLDEGARVLAEGAQAFLLDVDHGMKPFTTSSTTTSGGVSPGLGIPPQSIKRVIGVVKVTQSHVGDGPFVTENRPDNNPELLARLYGDRNAVDAEYGATTRRLRRLGNLDLAQIRRAIMVNGVSEIALTKLDWIPRYGKTAPVCVGYRYKGEMLRIAPDSARKLAQSEPVYVNLPTWKEDISGVRDFAQLPKNAQNYIKFIEQQTGVRISMIGVGPKHYQVILR